MKSNITLVGMPASGKSTIGVLLAKRLGYSFVDVDIVIQEKTGQLLKEIIAERGTDGFLKVEEESPLNLECKVKQVVELGSHDMFIAEILGVTVDDRYMDEKGTFHLNDAKLVSYSHGTYFELGEKIGTFGYSVRKDDKKTVRGKTAGKVSGKKNSRENRKDNSKRSEAAKHTRRKAK